MSIRPIVICGDPVLHTPARPVDSFDDQLAELIADMYETMDAARGVGLAAPQIGVGLRIFTWAMQNEDGVPARGVIVNPYVKASKAPEGNPDPNEETEGCLSVPGESFPLRRGERAEVSGFDEHGNEISFTATGWFARCMQHEYDHLNGFLYVDRLDGRWARKAKKAIRAHEWGVPGNSWMPGVDRDPFGHDDADASDGHDADPVGHREGHHTRPGSAHLHDEAVAQQQR